MVSPTVDLISARCADDAWYRSMSSSDSRPLSFRWPARTASRSHSARCAAEYASRSIPCEDTDMAADPDSEWIDDYAPGEGGTLTGEAVNLDLHPTGFILRAAGALIDFVVYLVLYWMITIPGLLIVTRMLGTEQAVFI